MDLVADLHLHSKYSRAVSPQMGLETMQAVAKQKGIHLLSLSDFTHPKWIKEVKEKLTQVREGIYTLSDPSITFLTATEISCIYSQNGKLRRIHLLVFLSSLEKAEEMNQSLLKRGANLHADGRPIVGMSAKSILELALSLDEKAMIIPAHAWTPHFGVYGSASGFDSLSECFEDLTPYIYGIETGISSDPEMNWQIAELENRSILSFSDAHSLPKMIREATIFTGDTKEFTYTDLWKAIKRVPGKLKVGYTIEFYPEEGKYHYSGHRNCKVSFSLEDVLKKGTVCPVCTRKLTEGVFIRLSQLAPALDTTRVESREDSNSVKWFMDVKKHHPSYVKLVPLQEVLAEAKGQQVKTKGVETLYQEILAHFGSELDILLRIPLGEIEKKMGERIAQGVLKNRKGEIAIVPGFDGEYGKISIWEEEERKIPQLNLF